MAMITVGRQSPRNSRIMAAVRHGRNQAFADHALNRRAHKQRLIEQRLDVHFRRQATEPPAAPWL